MADPNDVLRKHVARARSLYGNHAALWTALGTVGLFVSIALFKGSARASGMAGGLALALPVGISMICRYRALREGGPVLSLLAEPQRIVWHFIRLQSVRGRTGDELRRNAEVVIGDEDGDLVAFWIEERAATGVREALAAIAPHATAGHSEELAKAYAAEPLHLRKAAAEPPDPASGDGRLYRDAPPAKGEVDTARVERRRGKRRRKLRNRALAIGLPAVVIGAWLAGAHAEAGARDRHEVARTAWRKERGDAVARGALEALAASPAPAADMYSVCLGRFEGGDWAPVVFVAKATPEGVVWRETRGSRHGSSFGPPSDDWVSYAPHTTLGAMATAPWHWMIVAGAAAEPLFVAKMIDPPDAREPRVHVRAVDRETGEVRCDGLRTFHYSIPMLPCDDATDDADACARARHEDRLVELAVQESIREALWPEQ